MKRIFRHDDFTKPYYALRRGEDGAAGRLDEQLARLDAALAARPWLGGAEYGLADIAYVPWVLRARDMLALADQEADYTPTDPRPPSMYIPRKHRHGPARRTPE